jgi:hypothetical protein
MYISSMSFLLSCKSIYLALCADPLRRVAGTNVYNVVALVNWPGPAQLLSAPKSEVLHVLLQ